jgi:ribosomal protein S18 acetylase RimI-like enzyme
MEIRDMTAADKPGVMRMLRNTPEFTPEEVDLAEEVIDDYLADPQGSGYYTLVAEVDAQIAGFVIYGPVPITDNVWELYWFAVDKSLRRQGTGRKLWDTAEDNMWKAGARIMVMETSSKSEYDRTNLFYERSGYEIVGRIKDFYMIGDDQITYAKYRKK